jgi:hypothetical protein
MDYFNEQGDWYVKVILASQADNGKILWTLECRYWRPIHAEWLTHRVFARNSGSSRAIPFMKQVKKVLAEKPGPRWWGASQKGMQAKEEIKGWRRTLAPIWWSWSRYTACANAWFGHKVLGLHKSIPNRVIEPFSNITIIVSATEWDNFFELRDHSDALPEFQDLARAIRTVMKDYKDRGLIQHLKAGEWHLPYLLPHEISSPNLSLINKIKMSTARCSRVSYENLDATEATLKKEIQQHDSLVGSVPRHSSPAEHPCMAGPSASISSGPLQGFIQYRAFLEDGSPIPEPIQTELEL